MYCLDSNIIIDFLNNDEDIVNKIKEILPKGDLFITPISMCEIYKGIYLYGDVEEELRVFNEMLNWLNILDFSKSVCERFGKEYNKLKKKDKKHFENIDVKIEVW